MRQPKPLGGALERPEEPERTDDDALEDSDRQWAARKHFPHLSALVAPRESDETPTFWEE